LALPNAPLLVCMTENLIVFDAEGRMMNQRVGDLSPAIQTENAWEKTR
jgi:hypothetical protein